MAEASTSADETGVCYEPLSDLNDIQSFHNVDNRKHWFNYVWDIPENAIAYNILDSGVSIIDFLGRPSHQVEPMEWLAFNLHNLIDRVSIFYDFVTLRCNDGTRVLNVLDPLFYGADVTLEIVEPAYRNLFLKTNSECVGRVKIAHNECFAVDENLTHDFPILDWPVKRQDGEVSPTGASSYILKMIDKLKRLRDDPFYFPRDVSREIPIMFNGVGRYILFHLATIMSHVTTCHFKEIADSKLNRHLFTLNSWIFTLAAQYDFFPPANHMSSEFVYLCRHLIYVDSLIPRVRCPNITTIPVEGEPELSEEVPESESSDSPTSTNQEGNSNISQNNANARRRAKRVRKPGVVTKKRRGSYRMVSRTNHGRKT